MSLFKIKVSRKITKNDKEKCVLETYLTEALHFADAGYKIINLLGTENVEVEDVCLMKNFKPAINTKISAEDKLFIIKIAEDIIDENNNEKTVKYVMPCFAKNSIELQEVVSHFLNQGLTNMRLTTISETKWIWL